MVSGFVLINVAAGKEESVYKSLLDMGETEGVRQVFGQYDLIIRVEAEDLNELITTVIGKIRSVDGVTKTTTLIATGD